MGSPDAPVTMIEYSDFFCAHCQQFALLVKPKLEAEYIKTGQLRFIHKFMNVYTDESLKANEAAVCAAEQGRFWAYYYYLMGQMAVPGKNAIPVEKLQTIAEEIGLNIDQFNVSLLSDKYDAYVKQNDEDGRNMGVTGTPTFFINGIKQAGATNLDVLKKIIDPILQKTEK